MPLPQYKEIGYFHRDESVSNLSGDLPHWRQEGVTYFVTFRTADSLPQEKLKQWQLEKERWLHDHPEPCDEKSKREFYEKFPERLQHWLDHGYGECVLKEQDCKKIVEGALRHFDGQRYDLDEFVIMPNHVHVLVTPKAGHELSKILHSWKSFTATEINKRIGKSGAFWQKESFDHIVRSPAQVERIRQYIKEHPAYGQNNQSQDGSATIEVEAVSRHFQSGRGFQPLETQRQDAAATLNNSATIWTPAAGTFDGWPGNLSELKVLDPCCGSGHFLVAAFRMLVPMRMEMEGLSARDACDAVLRENLHGLEIDKRCVELAAFALALAAWVYPDAGGFRPLPELNVACSGLAISAKKKEWLALAGDNNNVRIALEELYKQFKGAPVLGSLINPEIGLAKGSLFELKWEEVGPLLTKALADEKDDEKTEMGIVAQGIAKAASLLVGKYNWVITNVPYLKRGNQCKELQDYIDLQYIEGKGDIATVFLNRCIGYCKNEGNVSVVLPQNWLFLTSYQIFREKLLKEERWNLISRLGAGAFETISGEVVKAILISISKRDQKNNIEQLFSGIDVAMMRTAGKKATRLLTAPIKLLDQRVQLSNPDSRIIFDDDITEFPLLEKIAESGGGVSTFDSPRFIFQFWELGDIDREMYIYCQAAPSKQTWFSGRNQVLKWEHGNGDLYKLMSDKKNLENYSSGIWKVWSRFVGKKGICVGMMNDLPATLYDGYSFDNNTGVIIPQDEKHLSAIWCFCSSQEYNEVIRKIDQKLNVTSGTLVKIPFDLDHWVKVAQKKYPNGLPKPYSDDPTQWIFHGHPAKVAEASSLWNQRQDAAATLQVAVARLLGYRWPAELDAKMELSDEQREWVNKRNGLLKHIDEDGIVCIPSVRGEETADGRLRALLTFVLSPDWSPSAEQELIKVTGSNASNLDEWIRDHFFEQHCKLFHHRPFIWHIWDGRRRDGFHALVNYHKLAEENGKGRQLLENLTYSYLGDWIVRQKEGVKRGEGGAEDCLAAALELQKRLIAIIEGEPPFDIFVRWKPIEEQSIGWEPDINDGVRINIRPFMADDIPGGRKGAGILRWKPNIKWSKDRGKDVASAPWFPLFKGDRINDHHLSLDEKRAARAEANRREGEAGSGGIGEPENGRHGEWVI
jgi:REP element-mobilizing transposase RayT